MIANEMGDIKVYSLNTCDWTVDYSLLVQLQNFGEEYTIKCPFYLIDHPEGTVLFDTGVSYEMQEDPESYGTYGAAHLSDFVDAIEMTEDQKPVNQLEDLGYSPSDIDYVIMSHLHVDHAGGISDFPEAEFIIHKDELQYAWWPDPAQRLFYVEGDFGVLRSPEYEVTEVDGRYDLFGDGSVVTIPTPGHSPGHQSLKIELDNTGTVVLAADAAHLRQGYELGLCTAFDWETEAALESMRTIRQEANKSDAMVNFLHDVDDWEKQLPEAPEYLD